MSGNDIASRPRYRHRWRAPAADGAVLQVPPLREAPQLLAVNRERLSIDRVVGALGAWDPFRTSARDEALLAARQHTSSYRDLTFADRNGNTVLMAGHQPKLFHPGVWIKNFALSQLAESARAVAVNLVIDNDLCGPSAVYVPHQSSDGAWRQAPVPYDQSSANLPMEFGQIVDRELFLSFAQRLRAALLPIVTDPLVEGLWRELPSIEQNVNRYAAIAQARHRLEATFGCRTWELPISRLAQTVPFCRFVADIAERMGEFQECHNQSLTAYQQLYKIRGQARPVPPLTVHDTWLEMPFWVYRASDPTRRRLFVKKCNGEFHWTDRADWKSRCSASNPIDALIEWQQAGLCIRPRALTTTLYSRMFLSDLFIHGIGGSMYDQVGDWIAQQFYGVQAPEFLTVSATFRLPFEPDTNVLPTPSELVSQRRAMWFHPERFVANGVASETAIQKRALLAKIPPRRSALKRIWNREIETVNCMLRKALTDDLARLDDIYQQAVDQMRDRAVWFSREYAFCCFPQDFGSRLATTIDRACCG